MTPMGALPCHPERNEVKSKDLYSNLDDILTELPRKARDDGGGLPFCVTLSGKATQLP